MTLLAWSLIDWLASDLLMVFSTGDTELRLSSTTTPAVAVALWLVAQVAPRVGGDHHCGGHVSDAANRLHQAHHNFFLFSLWWRRNIAAV